ncbi:MULTISPECIES: LacI family DNA-binding transcriptional regulator [Lactobacillales]|uniref:LacI family DNA-binding transcriptional regulator n=1 Tax=Lactobacillales TaxID=186826 RepID=UPI0011ECE7AF|nr:MULTISPECIES: LacI family DNA-binding transcriptional regulator [Lactobacillales]KAF3306238.1 substrate-binding domain-containing protein [Carnobacterium sp. PL17GRE32]MEC1386597.1 LacI family DNA-binding transcriptional regulator [Aerococcus viridans]
MVTIKDVSKLAGVSVATVSRALNDSGYVSEKSRQKVEAAVKELGFYPNEVARTLYHKKSKMIGLLVPDLSNPYFTALASGVEDGLSERGYGLLLGNVQDSSDKVATYVRNFEQNNVAGLLSAVSIKAEEIRNIPVVNLDRISNRDKYMVHADDYQGGQIAGTTIAQRNPGQLIVMVGPQNLQTAKDRLDGTLSVLNQKGIAYSLFETDSYQVMGATEVVENLFNQYPHMDSVIATNDIHGALIIQAALKRNISVPDKLQVLGYDNSSFGSLVYPALSTINQPAYDIGYLAAILLINRIEGKKIDQEKIKLPVNLVLRNSLREKVNDDA